MSRKFQFAIALLVLGLLSTAVQSSSAQSTPPLNYFKNYFLTGGDYAVAGWQKTGMTTYIAYGTGNTYATGNITFPDPVQTKFGATPPAISAIAPEIVAAFLYWQTVESAQTGPAGQFGVFNGFQIAGTPLLASSPVNWSSGGCSGSSGGTKTISTYRADVLRFLNLTTDGRLEFVGNNVTYPLTLADSGSNGNTAPFTLGATLVLVYRDLSPSSTSLNAVVIYNGAYSQSNQALVMKQTMGGFYQPTVSTTPSAKLTMIVGNGQSNKRESISFSTNTGGTVPLPSLYSAFPNDPFPGLYNGFWDNPTWSSNNYPPLGTAVRGSANTVTTATTTLTPDPLYPECVSSGAFIFATNVQDTDGDGLLDVWESQSGITDPKGNPLPDIHAMGADPNVKDLFIDLDYMCSALDQNGNCVTGTGQHSHKPSKVALDLVGDAFKKQGINVHFDIGNNYQNAVNPDPYIIQSSQATLKGGNQILETACSQTNPPTNPNCIFPNFPGTVGWKLDFLRYKNGDTTSSPPLPTYFDHSRKDMFHYVLFAHTLGLPRWMVPDGTLVSVAVQTSVAAVTTGLPHGLNPGDFVSISGAVPTANINGAYQVASVSAPWPLPGSTSFTISIPAGNNAPDGTYTNKELAVGNGTPRSTSGVGDQRGGDFMVTLGRWDNQVGSDFMKASTLMHELGHNLALGHGGDPNDTNNCKPNYQSIMNYLDQVGGLIDASGVAHIDYSGIALPALPEDSLFEATGLNYPLTLPYLPRWYAPASSARATKLGISPATLHCNGTTITDGAKMVRADGDVASLTGPIDWDWNGNGTIDAGLFTQDVNFDGSITGPSTSTTPFQGFNDWLYLEPKQLGSRWNFVFSLDVRLSEDNGDMAFTTTPTWNEVLSDWSDLEVLGTSAGGGLGTSAGGGLGTSAGGGLGTSAGGGLGTSAGGGLGTSAGGGLGTSAGGGLGEQNVETAAANGNNPSGLTATATKLNIDLNWSAPNLGTVNFYQVWRGTCPKGTTSSTCNIDNSSPSILPAGSNVPRFGNNCDGGFMFCDTTTTNNVLYLYFVEANITYPPKEHPTTQQSGPSNTVTKSR